MSKNVSVAHTAMQAKYPRLADLMLSEHRDHVLSQMVRDELYVTPDKLSEMFDAVLDAKHSIDVIATKFRPSEVLKKLNREDYNEYLQHWVNDQVINGEMFEVTVKTKKYVLSSKVAEDKLLNDYDKRFPRNMVIHVPAYLADELEITLGKGTKEFSEWIVDAIERKLSRESMRG